MHILDDNKIHLLVSGVIVRIALYRFAVNSIFTIPTYDEWKDRRKAFDTAFTRK